MFLEYLRFKEKGAKIIEFRTKKGLKYHLFNPTGELPDEFGAKVLERYGLEFREVAENKPSPANKLICPLCGFEGKNIKAITMHMSIKHKEQKK